MCCSFLLIMKEAYGQNEELCKGREGTKSMGKKINQMAGKVKVRSVSTWSIIATICLACLCLGISFYGFNQYAVLRSAMQDYISCEDAVHELQEGSDLLTKQVRLAAATGDPQYIDAYFQEANVTRSREKAVSDLTALKGSSSDAIQTLQSALSASVDLMQTEYYSMRLVEESIGSAASSWPQELQDTVLSSEDASLSSKEKLLRAQQLVFSTDYEKAKDIISGDVNAAIDAITEEINSRQNHAADIFSHIFRLIIACVMIFAAMMLLSCLLIHFWVVRPLLSFHKDIEHDAMLSVSGANELQSLANTYNKIYQENEERQRLIQHQAEHDPLTDLLNRGSYDRILNLYIQDKKNFALILIDVDVFKSVNDTYGHAIGDAILKKVAHLLTVTFRTIDYVCRIGGDEFAIIMVEMTSDLNYTITEKIDIINAELSIPKDGMPAISLSVGVALTDRRNPGKSQFTDADRALYYTKEHGKHGCTFYPADPSADNALNGI